MFSRSAIQAANERARREGGECERQSSQCLSKWSNQVSYSSLTSPNLTLVRPYRRLMTLYEPFLTDNIYPGALLNALCHPVILNHTRAPSPSWTKFVHKCQGRWEIQKKTKSKLQGWTPVRMNTMEQIRKRSLSQMLYSWVCPWKVSAHFLPLAELSCLSGKRRGNRHRRRAADWNQVVIMARGRGEGKTNQNFTLNRQKLFFSGTKKKKKIMNNLHFLVKLRLVFSFSFFFYPLHLFLCSLGRFPLNWIM